MAIFVLNCGSSTVKFKVFAGEKVAASGMVERIGQPSASIQYESGSTRYLRSRPIASIREAIKACLDACTNQEWGGVLARLEDVEAVGHRVVHGGERFHAPVVIDAQVEEDIEACVRLAPLHNPANLEGVRVCRELLKQALEVAVFDTAFHQTMMPRSYLYALPMSLYSRHRVRRYGFHGTSHQYVDERVRKLTSRDAANLKVITCHLGNGASVAALRGGVVQDTSMGMTPLEGLVMGTRCGDLDPSILPYVMAEENLDPAALSTLLNKQSGMLGISGLSGDMRELEEAAQNGDRRAELAIEIFCYRLKKYIGSYMAALGGVDAVVFTGGIGENSAWVRELALDGLEGIGLRLEKNRNRDPGLRGERRLDEGQGAELWVIPTNEELVIARAARGFLEKANGNGGTGKGR